MGKLLWLASYPKSGNTWIRAFLANYLANGPTPVDINALPEFAVGDMRAEHYARAAGRPVAELSPGEINRLRPRVHALLAGDHPGVTFIKTHNLLGSVDGVPLITPEVTLGAIYIVRNPLDVAVSFADHYGLDIARGVAALCFPELKIEPRADQVAQYVGDWSGHVRSWREAAGLNLCFLRYEDLLRQPRESFAALTEFLKLPSDVERLERAIRHSSFPELAAQEQQHGFRERSRHARRFFRAGKTGGWKKALKREHVDRLLATHGKVMVDLGYLSRDGRITI